MWRGMQASLRVAREIFAAEKIQHNWRAIQRKMRNAIFNEKVVMLQAATRGLIVRAWLRKMNKQATCIQKYARRMLVLAALGNKDFKKTWIALINDRRKLDANRANLSAGQFMSARAIMNAKLLTACGRKRRKTREDRKLLITNGQARENRIARKQLELKKIGSKAVARESIYQPIAFAKRINRTGVVAVRKPGSQMTEINKLVESVRRAYNIYLPANLAAQQRNSHPAAKRGIATMRVQRIVKKPRHHSLNQPLSDEVQYADWQTRYFTNRQTKPWENRCANMWLSKVIGERLVHQDNRKTLDAIYTVSNTMVGGFLSRKDDVRPAWISRIRIPSADALGDGQKLLAKLTDCICAKMHQSVTIKNENSSSLWNQGVSTASDLWRTIFCAAVKRECTETMAYPVLFMTVSQGIYNIFWRYLSEIWRETNNNFTKRVNFDYNLKSRPEWHKMEETIYKVFGEQGFGVEQKSVASDWDTRKASDLLDYAEEVFASRLALDWLGASIRSGEEFCQAMNKRNEKAAQMNARGEKPKDESKTKNNDFSFVESTDGELR
eukprot:gene129-920_t